MGRILAATILSFTIEWLQRPIQVVYTMASAFDTTRVLAGGVIWRASILMLEMQVVVAWKWQLRCFYTNTAERRLSSATEE